jgi:hypothetical protein
LFGAERAAGRLQLPWFAMVATIIRAALYVRLFRTNIV